MLTGYRDAGIVIPLKQKTKPTTRDDKIMNTRNNIRNSNLLIDYFGDNEYRELLIGEKIVVRDVFICKGKIYSATDIGNGIYTTNHFPHYRRK